MLSSLDRIRSMRACVSGVMYVVKWTERFTPSTAGRPGDLDIVAPKQLGKQHDLFVRQWGSGLDLRSEPLCVRIHPELLRKAGRSESGFWALAQTRRSGTLDTDMGRAETVLCPKT